MKKARTIMVQGTASSAGKSVLVTALCRIFRQDGHRVAPFKAQNMALNSYVTAEGGEIGRAQAVQAEAAGIPPTVDMNPVLLKPTKDTGCQVVVLGKVARNVSAHDYYDYTPSLLKTVEGSLARLRAAYDIVVIEGAGSPAEINLKEREIVNMRVARMSGSPVLLVGDIDKGGVFASLVGTLELLDADERDYVKGMVINKFRGDVSLLKPALDFLEKRTGRPVLGVVPYFRDIRIAQEDSVYLDERPNGAAGGDLTIAVIRLPHISNYDDFDPLEEEGCTVHYVTQRFELGSPHLIIVPGTKSTVADLAYLRHSGLDRSIVARARAGTPVVGICGGYQMLGRQILDPRGVESENAGVAGLGLLDVVTEFAPEKSTRQVRARVLADAGLLAGTRGLELTGYEIHLGRTLSSEKAGAFQIVATPQGPADYADGALDAGGRVLGTYIHGLFHNDAFRKTFLGALRNFWGMAAGPDGAPPEKDKEYDKLAALVRASLDIPRIYRIMEAGV
ncbi:MAG TPA: cobyric acid synthase [Dehalococcoidales bacterium]|nr:cobyric acid synthase [Dehalococcoidales bacterium]